MSDTTGVGNALVYKSGLGLAGNKSSLHAPDVVVGVEDCGSITPLSQLSAGSAETTSSPSAMHTSIADCELPSKMSIISRAASHAR